MISVEKAWNKICQSIPQASPISVPLEKALGFVSARDIRAAEDAPAFAASAMDGFGIRQRDVSGASKKKPARLTIADVIPAGKVPGAALKPQTAVRIFTGAIVPKGVDAVVMQEHTETRGDSVFVKAPARKGENIRRKGEEIRKGSVCLREGNLITPPAVALLASLGVRRLAVYRKPKVSFFTTGDELIGPSEKSRPGKIRDSHSFSIPAAIEDIGVPVKVLKRCRDNKRDISSRIRSGIAGSDVLVISGGVSVGEFDLVREALGENEVEEVFWQVAIKPGKPLLFGKKGEKLVFGLPGNPAASLVTTYFFVRPALLRSMGLKRYGPRTIVARIEEGYVKKSRRTEFLRAKLTVSPRGEITVRILKHQGSHMLKSFAQADCLVIAPQGKQRLLKGDKVRLMPLPWAFG